VSQADKSSFALSQSFEIPKSSFVQIIRAEGPWNVLFFLMSVFLGPFYLLNLLLAVVALAYSKESKHQVRNKLSTAFLHF